MPATRTQQHPDTSMAPPPARPRPYAAAKSAALRQVTGDQMLGAGDSMVRQIRHPRGSIGSRYKAIVAPVEPSATANGNKVSAAAEVAQKAPASCSSAEPDAILGTARAVVASILSQLSPSAVEQAKGLLATPHAAATSDSLLPLANLLRKQRKWAQAATLYETQARLQPENFSALLGLGTTRYKLGQYDAAIVTLDRLVEQSPQLAVYRHLLGLSHLRAGHLPLARHHFEAAIPLSKAAMHFKWLGITQAQMGEYSLARDTLCAHPASMRDAESVTLVMTLQAKLGQMGLAAKMAKMLATLPDAKVSQLLLATSIQERLLDSLQTSGLLAPAIIKNTRNQALTAFTRQAKTIDAEFLAHKDAIVAEARAYEAFLPSSDGLDLDN